jgi:hypothetical protein
VDLLHGYHFLSFSVLALEDGGELTIAEFSPLNVLIIEAKVVGLLLQAFYPIGNGFLISVEKCLAFEQFLVVANSESVVVGAFLVFKLGDI